LISQVQFLVWPLWNKSCFVEGLVPVNAVGYQYGTEHQMTSDGRQSDNSETEALPGPLAHSGLKSAGRRRFGKSGIAVSGVLVTLASGPVLGDIVCKSPSGALSGNLSSHGTPPVCTGVSPGYWKNHTDWPIANRDTVKFKTVFTTTPGSPYGTVTMLTLLDHQDYDTNNLGMHLVAAYLNAMAGRTPFLTVETIKSMWTEIQTVGYFTPTAGTHWTSAQVVAYITSTQS
jgi:hypothetical protein